MATADKTYINKEQYILVKKWWLKTRKKQKRELGAEIYMYPFQYLSHETYDNGYDKPPIVHYNYDPSESDLDVENMGDDCTVWNTSTKQNFWIAKNCPFDFIQNQIRAKLGEEFYQEIPDNLKALSLIDKMTFDEPDRVLSITNKNTYLYFWEKTNKEIFYIDKMLVYGTTFLYKIIYDFTKISVSNKKFNYTVEFVYCGLNFEFNKGRMFYISKGKKQEVYIPFFRFGSLKLPEFKHCWKTKDCENVNKAQILFSFDDKVFDLSMYQGEETNKRLLMQLPRYIYEQIK